MSKHHTIYNDERVLGPAMPVCNRDADTFTLPEDGWIHTVALGEFPGEVEGIGKIIQVIDEHAINRIRESFEGELMVDRDHLSHDMSEETRAAAWVAENGVRPDGLYVRPRWTTSGRADVEGGEYRFVSPEFPFASMEHLGGNRYRPTQLTGLALTNRPGIKTLKPISNRRKQTETTTKNRMNHREMLIQLLGLSEDATDEQIQAAMQNGPPVNQELQQTVENRERELTETRDALAERDLDAAGVTDKDRREKLKPMLVTNREAGLAWLEEITASRQAAARPAATAIHNRAGKPTPQTPGSEERKTKQDANTAAAVRNRAHEIMGREKISWGVAFNRAKAEITKTEA